MQLISKYDNSWFIWFKEAFNDEVVIARCLVQEWQTLSSFLIFCYYFSRLKACETSQNMRNSENISHIALGTVR